MGWCDSADCDKQTLLMEGMYRKQDGSNECVGITLINNYIKVVSLEHQGVVWYCIVKKICLARNMENIFKQMMK